jgi:heptosyltransferase-2
LLNDIRRLDKQQLPKMVQRFVALANEEASITIPEVLPPKLVVDSAIVQQVVQRRQLSEVLSKPVLVLCPGAAYGPAKQWPTEAYAALAKGWLAKGWSVWLMGSGSDQAVCAKIKQANGEGCIDWSGQLTLTETLVLMSLATAVVSNDSGLMHVAAALERPVVALYGSTDPGFAPPLNKQHRIVYLDLACSPCAQRACPLGHLACLRQMSVAQVDSALEALLG